MLTGIETTIATNMLAPVVKGVVEAASGAAKEGLKKWQVKGFEKKLAQKVASVSKVKTIWSPEKETSLLKFYYPSKVIVAGEGDQPPQVKEVISLSDIGANNVVLQGTVGQGKSVFLRYLAMQELGESSTGRIPVLIELRTITSKKTLLEQIYSGLEKLDLKADGQLFDYLASAGKLVLLLDGYAELEQSEIAETHATIEFLVEKYSQLQIIVTSRPQNGIQNSRLFGVLELFPLTPEDYKGFLSKMGIKPIRSAEIIDAISKSTNEIKEIITTPLMLTLLVLVYQSEKKIPTEFSEFFEVLFHTVFTKHDSLKANFQRKHHSGLSEKKLELLFEGFCFMVMQNGYGRSLNTDQFESAFLQAQDYVEGCNCAAETFRRDITKVSCLMLEEGLNFVTFLHKSIMEYFASAFIKHCADPSAKKFYSAVRENASPWRQVLAFLSVVDSYRFQLYYQTPNIEEFFALLGASPENPAGVPNEKIISFMLSHTLRTRVMFRREGGEGTFILTGAGWGDSATMAPNAGLIADVICDVLFAGIARTPLPSRSIAHLADNGQLHSDDPGRFYSMSLPAFIEEFGEEAIVAEMQIFLTQLQSEWQSMKDMVAREHKKSLIFERKS